MVDNTTAWIVIAILGIGTFLIRFSFLGIIGDRPLPNWLLRHLRYTAVAVLPGLVAPLVVFPAATDGAFDAPRVTAAIVTLAVGVWRRDVLTAIAAGAVTLYGMLWIAGAGLY